MIFGIKDPIAFGIGFLAGLSFIDWWRSIVSVLLSLPSAVALMIVGAVAWYFFKGSPIRFVPGFSSGFGFGLLMREANFPT